MTEGTTARPLGTPRGILFGIVVFIATLGIYGLYWTYQTFEELKRHTGEGVGGFIALAPYVAFFVPPFEPIGMLPAFLAPREVGRMYRSDGRDPTVNGWTGLWFFPGVAIIVGPFVWFVKVQGALNRYWEAKADLPTSGVVAEIPGEGEHLQRETEEVVAPGRSTLGAGLLVLALAPLSWLFVCGGLLVALALPNDGVSPSDNGLGLFLIVPALLWVVTAGVIVWGWRASGRFAGRSAVPVVAVWWVVSAIAAYVVAFSV